MRPALLAAAVLALSGVAAPLASAQPGVPASVTDIRCVIVAGTLAQSEDPQMKTLGTASILYFWGRMEGRGDTANVSARLLAEAQKMTPDDIKVQAKTCGDMVSAAGQALQQVGDSVQKGASPAPAPPK
jgi:hypothetical protein